MRITKVNIPANVSNNGLNSIKMDRLGPIVLVAGKNGSGKTRILNTIINVIGKKPTSDGISNAKNNLVIFKNSLDQSRMQLAHHKHKLSSRINLSATVIENIKRNIESDERSIKVYEDSIVSTNSVLVWNDIETDGYYSTYQCVNFLPKTLTLVDSNTFSKTDLLNRAKAVDTIGFQSLAAGSFARIQHIQDRWFNATHQHSTIDKRERQSIIEEYERLKELIRIILDAYLDRNSNAEATIFGFPLGQSKLSDGQKILIQFCVAIHCQEKSLDNLILFLDEPENHLHPSVIIDVVERIKKVAPNGQIWIATHSVPLLSYFDPSSLWFVENGSISYAGTTPEKVLNGLLGGEEQIAKLQDFISLPGMFALSRHAYESLFHPPTLNTDSSDPQSLQINSEIKAHLKDATKIRVLDYGVGRGRLFSNIIENNKEPLENLIKWFDYVAYDKYDKDKEECLAKLQAVYPDHAKRYFNEFSQLLALKDKGSFDVVVMCNVLHEIDPKEWLKLFGKGGQITTLLSENGILLLVEDQEMPIGEKAYQKGFIVLNTPDLKELFKITETDTDFDFSDARGDGRLKAHRIRKEYLERITAESRVEALKSINKTAKEKILDVRERIIDYKNGKRHGFWIQQFANTQLAIEELA